MRDKILRFIAEYILENKWAPSYREIMASVGLKSTSTVMHHIHSLERDGMILFGNGPRKIAMTDKGWESVK